MSIRPIKSITQSKPTMEGAGVHLRRAFGFGKTSEFDPFLLFDDFRGDNPSDYLAGFPWHPHRGIETITYVLAGTVNHGDSLGNKGSMGAGDVQWMTAGSGIMHQEMPTGDAQGRMHGFQLWANLPARLKMTAPRYPSSAETSGARAVRSKASPPIRGTSTSRSRRASGKRCRSTPRVTRSPTSSQDQERSAMPRSRCRSSRNASGPQEPRRRQGPR